MRFIIQVNFIDLINFFENWFDKIKLLWKWNHSWDKILSRTWKAALPLIAEWSEKTKNLLINKTFSKSVEPSWTNHMKIVSLQKIVHCWDCLIKACFWRSFHKTSVLTLLKGSSDMPKLKLSTKSKSFQKRIKIWTIWL